MLQEIIESIKAYFRAPSAEVLALKELEDSRRKLLEAQSGREYAESMCKYYDAKIKRLTSYLHSATEEKCK